MVTNQRITIYVTVITTVLAVPFFLSWLNSINTPVTSPWPWLWIDVHFKEGYLNVTMTTAIIISEVTLQWVQREILAHELLHEPISS